MMRQVKFRLWDKANNQMITRENIDVLLKNINNNDSHVYQQWTGLQDKKGVDIYEGDVVRCLEHELTYKVTFNDRGCFIACSPDNILDFCLLDDYTFNVIGNIYENPELLENP